MFQKFTFRITILTLLFSLKIHTQIPPNNECTGAINITIGNQINGTTQFATFSGVNASCSSFFSEPEVWYTFTAPTSGEINLQLDGGLDLGYVIYNNCPASNAIACGEGGASSVNNLQVGTTYYISVTKIALDCRGDCDNDFTLLISEPSLSQDQFVIDSFTYYPNPVKDRLIIKSRNTIAKVDLYTLLGEKIKSKIINALDTEINFSDLQSGVYFINVYSNSTTKTIKIIKN